MPIYEYKCLDCGKITEFFFRTPRDNIDLSCAGCHSKSLEKIFSTPAAVSLKSPASEGGLTCCGSTERCDSPPCSGGDPCRRDQNK